MRVGRGQSRDSLRFRTYIRGEKILLVAIEVGEMYSLKTYEREPARFPCFIPIHMSLQVSEWVQFVANSIYIFLYCQRV